MNAIRARRAIDLAAITAICTPMYCSGTGKLVTESPSEQNMASRGQPINFLRSSTVWDASCWRISYRKPKRGGVLAEFGVNGPFDRAG